MVTKNEVQYDMRVATLATSQHRDMPLGQWDTILKKYNDACVATDRIT